MNKPVINVLTRTSNRPTYFYNCVKSIDSQLGRKKINHIVSVDDIPTARYVDSHGISFIAVKKLYKNGYDHAPYNLYLNDMLKHISEGWVVILDDDDKFMNSRSIASLLPHMGNSDNLLLWKVQFPHSTIPEPIFFGKKPEICHISMIGFSFHSKFLYTNPELKFTDSQTGDFEFISKLYDIIPNKIWIDEVLTGLQRTNTAGGFGQPE